MHLDLPPELLPDDYVLVTIDLDELPVEEVAAMPNDPREFGDDWLRTQRTPVLRVPSAIVPESANLLINPIHRDAGRARIVESRLFAFDSRLWRQA